MKRQSTQSKRITHEELENFQMTTNLILHELRNPLAVVKAETQILLSGRQGKLNTKQKDGARSISRNIEKMENFITDILDIARLESFGIEIEIKRFKIKEILDEAIKNFKRLALQKKQRLIVNCGNLGWMRSDPDRIYQVMSNLLSNAVKFTPEKGVIQVTAKKEKGMFILVIKDTGIGIRKNDLKKIFLPFHRSHITLRKRYQGAGIGLAICRAICESLDGKIRVESVPGKGSTFTITLPLDFEKVASPVQKVKPSKKR